jgi:hypothetical protein
MNTRIPNKEKSFRKNNYYSCWTHKILEDWEFDLVERKKEKKKSKNIKTEQLKLGIVREC